MDEPGMKKILAVMSDLFFAAQINDEAKKLAMTAVFVTDQASAIEQLDSNPALVILDLNCASARPLELIGEITARDPAIPTVGFVSHVQEDLKRKALEAGCGTVLARSVFAKNVQSLIAAQVPAGD